MSMLTKEQSLLEFITTECLSDHTNLMESRSIWKQFFGSLMIAEWLDSNSLNFQPFSPKAK